MINENISIKQNNACFIGTLESILTDAKLDKMDYKSVIESFNKITFESIDTRITPNQITKLLQNYFCDFSIYEIKNIDLIVNCTFKDFTIILWEGKNILNAKGKIDNINRHATRYIESNNHSIILMDPQEGIIRPFVFYELTDYSPNGFNLVTFNRKKSVLNSL